LASCKAEKEDRRPAFALHNASDFDGHMCAGVPDAQWVKVEQKDTLTSGDWPGDRDDGTGVRRP